MAQIVCIAEGTKRDNNNIDDIVGIEDDNVELGDSYSTFKIYKVTGVTAAEIFKKINLNPYRDEEYSGPKYAYSMSTISKEDETKLEDVKVGTTETLAILDKVKENG